jgi:hypothetical protein
MHPVDKAFYDLTVKERDRERIRADRFESERDVARQALLLLAAGSESAVLALEGDPYFDAEEEGLSNLIDRGLLATKRTGTETYAAVLTDAGRDLIRTVLQEAPKS